ncbi:hypothetical protein [Actinopolymorpha pittospori]
MSDHDPIRDLPTIASGAQAAPPAWARSQRELLREFEDAALTFVDRYARPDGTLPWRTQWPGMDGSDDPYEGFQGLPMLYLLGGGERLLSLARRQWEAVTWQWTEYGQIHREFDAYYDWMHHGEANNLLYLLAQADPTSFRERQRAVTFARLYTGEDPAAPNYDPARRLIRSPLTGSRGPRFTCTAEDWSTHREVLDNYPPPFEDLPGVTGPKCQWTDDAVYAEILDRMNARMTRGDVPLNLTSTSLMAHAYLYTGDARFRDWVLDYHEAWRARAERNGGIIPDNVGLDDVIGQYMDGAWWGGYYGWRWPHGASQLVEAVAIGSINAVLLDGKTAHLDLVRSQLDELWALGREEDDGWVTPYKHLDAGWTDFRPPDYRIPVACWSLSHEQQDLDRVLRLPGSERWGEPTDRMVKGNGAANSQHWFAYVQGGSPDYPNRILEVNHRQLQERMEQIRHDDGDPAEWDVHHWQNMSPVFPEGLVQLMHGTPLHLYHGGLQFATVRYFDAVARRTGLPPEVAALVERVDGSSATVHLVNCGNAHRDLVVQAGGFGEHVIEHATVLTGDGSSERQQVEGKWLRVRIGPGAQVRLRLALRRFANDPSYDTPWSTRADRPALLRGRDLDGPA